MVLIDSNNKKLKVFNYMSTYRAAYSFGSSEYGPKALAVLNNDEVVVSVYAETLPLWTKLHILNISSEDITYTQSVPIESLRPVVIRAIACHQGKIFIAGNCLLFGVIDHPFMKLIDRDGNTYWTTTMTDKNACPYYMTCLLHQECLSVFVVDVNNNKVWKYDGNTGGVLGCYEKGSLRGITSGGGIIFASYSRSKDIYAFTPNMDGKKLAIRGRSFPLFIKYHEIKNVKHATKHHRLLVSNHCDGKTYLSNYVDFYQLTSGLTFT